MAVSSEYFSTHPKSIALERVLPTTLYALQVIEFEGVYAVTPSLSVNFTADGLASIR